MTKPDETMVVEMVPIERISVPNPRVRSKVSFDHLVDSISKVGLKKPITLTHRDNYDGVANYDLVCGQGRLEAFAALGQREIPAIIEDVSDEDRMLRSVVENIARRQHRPLELLRDIGELRKRGYSDPEIATKTGLHQSYVQSIGRLLAEGETRLIVAVETGRIPLNVALEIAEVDLDGAQEALAKAYESGALRGKKLLAAKRIVELRQRQGKSQRTGRARERGKRLSSDALVRAYNQEADRQRLLIKRAEIAQNRLLFIVTAMRALLADAHFATLLRAEKLETLPRPLTDLIIAGET
jgi:ParB family transcriptional regulator, chromosome partitioning protein